MEKVRNPGAHEANLYDGVDAKYGDVISVEEVVGYLKCWVRRRIADRDHWLRAVPEGRAERRDGVS